MLQEFIKSYWSYYLELEFQFIETKRFVEFGENNAKTYSVEYLKLYQAVCSEIDVVGKEIAKNLNPNFNVNNSNICKWGYQIQQKFKNIKNIKVLFIQEQKIHPFKNWEYETYSDTKGAQRIRLAGNVKGVIPWWTSYNKVKHQRIGLVTGTQNFSLANQKNLIQAFSALFLLETLFIDYLKETDNCNGIIFEESKLFAMTK